MHTHQDEDESHGASDEEVESSLPEEINHIDMKQEQDINTEYQEALPSSKYFKIVNQFQELLDNCRSTMDSNDIDVLPILPFLNSVQINICSGRRMLRESEKTNRRLTAYLENIAVPR